MWFTLAFVVWAFLVTAYACTRRRPFLWFIPAVVTPLIVVLALMASPDRIACKPLIALGFNIPEGHCDVR